MKKERWEELERTGAKLDIDEMKAGWHYCEEFDGLLTDGEMKDENGVCCFCGFDPRKVTGEASKSSNPSSEES